LFVVGVDILPYFVILDRSPETKFQEHDAKISDTVLKAVDIGACCSVVARLLKGLGKRARYVRLIRADFGGVFWVI
jgi:hypothetical protein